MNYISLSLCFSNLSCQPSQWVARDIGLSSRFMVRRVQLTLSHWSSRLCRDSCSFSSFCLHRLLFDRKKYTFLHCSRSISVVAKGSDGRTQFPHNRPQYVHFDGLHQIIQRRDAQFLLCSKDQRSIQSTHVQSADLTRSVTYCAIPHSYKFHWLYTCVWSLENLVSSFSLPATIKHSIFFNTKHSILLISIFAT